MITNLIYKVSSPYDGVLDTTILCAADTDQLPELLQLYKHLTAEYQRLKELLAIFPYQQFTKTRTFTRTELVKSGISRVDISAMKRVLLIREKGTHSYFNDDGEEDTLFQTTEYSVEYSLQTVSTVTEYVKSHPRYQEVIAQ